MTNQPPGGAVQPSIDSSYLEKEIATTLLNDVVYLPGDIVLSERIAKWHKAKLAEVLDEIDKLPPHDSIELDLLVSEIRTKEGLNHE